MAGTGGVTTKEDFDAKIASDDAKKAEVKKLKDEWAEKSEPASAASNVKRANQHLRTLGMQVRTFAHVKHPEVKAMQYANPMLGMMGMISYYLYTCCI